MQSPEQRMGEPYAIDGFNNWHHRLPAQLNGQQKTRPAAQPFRRILAAVDLSDRTQEILHCALALAERTEAVLDVLHVIHLNIAGEAHGIPRTRLIEEMSEAARQEMYKLTEALLRGDVIATISVREGRPEEAILREAAATRADLIVMGERPSSFWRRLFGRDVLSRVLHHSTCPVMAVGVGASAAL